MLASARGYHHMKGGAVKFGGWEVTGDRGNPNIWSWGRLNPMGLEVVSRWVGEGLLREDKTHITGPIF